MKVLISGGGTGGHIFPAISIANALREMDPHCEILFVGALGRMEMERVPQAGYKIVGLPVRGIDRSRPWRNIKVLIDFVRSMWQVRKIIREQSGQLAKTDEAFSRIKTGIHDSVEGINQISIKTKRLDEARIEVVDVVHDLTAIAEENAAGAEETSASVTEVTNIVAKISEKADYLRKIAEQLEDEMNIFKL